MTPFTFSTFNYQTSWLSRGKTQGRDFFLQIRREWHKSFRIKIQEQLVKQFLFQVLANLYFLSFIWGWKMVSLVWESFSWTFVDHWASAQTKLCPEAFRMCSKTLKNKQIVTLEFLSRLFCQCWVSKNKGFWAKVWQKAFVVLGLIQHCFKGHSRVFCCPPGGLCYYVRQAKKC